MYIASILAGGSGSRMGNSNKPKQFLELQDKPVIVHTLTRFLFHKEFEHIIVATPKEYIEHTQELVNKHLSKDQASRITICTGGSDRTGSIINTIKKAEELVKTTDFIIVTHDAARPLVAFNTIKDNLELSKDNSVVDTVIAATDTIIESKDSNIISNIPERKTMFQGQTPQTFNAKHYLELIEKSDKETLAKHTDACGLFTAAGVDVKLAHGTSSNIKLTTPYDLRVLSAMIEIDQYDK